MNLQQQQQQTSGQEKSIEFVSKNQNVIKFQSKMPSKPRRSKSINLSINIDENKVLTPHPHNCLLASQIRNVINK